MYLTDEAAEGTNESDKLSTYRTNDVPAIAALTGLYNAAGTAINAGFN